MLDRIRALFDPDRGAADRPHDALQMAAAALMVEAARSDETFGAAERARILELVRERFALAEEDARTLLAAAETHMDTASGLFDDVRTIIDRCPPDRRVWIIEMLWEVAYADGRLDEVEASLLRRVGGLLAVPDQERGAARLRVLDRLGLPDDTGL